MILNSIKLSSLGVLLLSMASCQIRQFNKPTQSLNKNIRSQETKLLPDELELIRRYQFESQYTLLLQNDRQEIIDRFMIPIANLHKIIEGTLAKTVTLNETQKLEALANSFKVQRTEFFRFESLLKIYKEINSYADFMKPLYTQVKNNNELRANSGIKEIEDLVGDFAEADMNLNFAKTALADEKTIRTLQTKREQFLKKLGELAVADWLPHADGRIPFFIRFFKVITENQSVLVENSEDSKKLVKEFSKIIKEFQERPLNFNDMENGFHELRRNLRWIPIITISLDGLILPDQTAPKAGITEYDESLENPLIKASKYAEALTRLKRPKAFKKMPLALYFSSALYAEKIGVVKDLWQNHEALVSAAVLNGQTQELAKTNIKLLLQKSGVEFSAYQPIFPLEMLAKKRSVLFDFEPMGQEISNVVKDSKTGIFPLVLNALK